MSNNSFLKRKYENLLEKYCHDRNRISQLEGENLRLRTKLALEKLENERRKTNGKN